MIDRALLEHRLASSVTGWFWGWWLVMTGLLAAAGFWVSAVVAQQSVRAVLLAAVASGGAMVVAGALWMVWAHSAWKSAKPLLGLEAMRSWALRWEDPGAALDDRKRIRLVADGGCAYCGTPAPVKEREWRAVTSEKRSHGGWGLWLGLVGYAIDVVEDICLRRERALPAWGGRVELGYALCEPCRSIRPRFAWAPWALVAGVLVAGLNLVLLLRGGATPTGIESGAWGLLVVGLPLGVGIAFPIARVAARDLGAPVQITLADVGLGIALEAPPHLIIRLELPPAGEVGPTIPPPRYC